MAAVMGVSAPVTAGSVIAMIPESSTTSGNRLIGSPRAPSHSWYQPPASRSYAIVVDALRAGVGSSLPTNSHYLHTLGASAGTVQRAMKFLADQRALTVTSRGHLGRTLDSLDIGAAWHLAGLTPLRLLFPPGGPVEIDVLTEALAGELTALGVPHTVHHQRGAARRIDAIVTGDYDLVVVSAGTLDDAARRLESAPTLVLPPGTYYAPRRLVAVTRTAAPEPGPGARVAIDYDSPDHVLLTESAYPPDHGYVYVPCEFPGVPAAVLRSQVDVGVWHLSHTVIPLDLAGLSCTDLEDLPTATAWRDLSAAALVGRPRRGELTAVLAAINLPTLTQAQRHHLRHTP
ncbi:YhfZ family protein [Streptomyces sp. NBC_01508]|uniref:YhfZ family protein n=1 Tax=Streptomyces sp. NBC_01508 TaxID=2903888 RepID=UPI00386A39A7